MDGGMVGWLVGQRDRYRNMLLHSEIVGTILIMITSDIIIGKTGEEESYKKKRNQPEYRLYGDFENYVLKSLRSDITERRYLTPAIKMGTLQNALNLYVSIRAGLDHKETTLKSRNQDSQHPRMLF